MLDALGLVLKAELRILQFALHTDGILCSPVQCVINRADLYANARIAVDQ